MHLFIKNIYVYIFPFLLIQFYLAPPLACLRATVLNSQFFDESSKDNKR